MHLNIHLNKDEISEALKVYIESKGFTIDGKPMVTMAVEKGDQREQETWSAVLVGCRELKKE